MNMDCKFSCFSHYGICFFCMLTNIIDGYRKRGTFSELTKRKLFPVSNNIPRFFLAVDAIFQFNKSSYNLHSL